MVTVRTACRVANARYREGTAAHGRQETVQDVTYDLLRSLGLTTVFGNPGSTEETFLKLSRRFHLCSGLQEASVFAMADGFAQSTGKPRWSTFTRLRVPVTRWGTWWPRPRQCPADHYGGSADT